MRNANRPRYDRCDYCGRGKHQIAVRVATGEVLGICPLCWHGKINHGTGVAVRFADDQIVYDRRTRKLPIFLGFSGKHGDPERAPQYLTPTDPKGL